MKEELAAFYTYPHFWAGEAPDFKNLYLDDVREMSSIGKSLFQTAFEYKHESFILQIHKDGLIGLQIKELEESSIRFSENFVEYVKWWGKYLDYLNCLYFVIDSTYFEKKRIAFFELSEITNNDVFRIEINEHWPPRYRVNYRTILPQYAHMHPDRVGYIDPFFFQRLAIDKEIFDDINDKFSSIVVDKNLISLLSTTARSISQFKIGNFSTSIVLSWFAIESMLNKKWQSWIDRENVEFEDGNMRISNKRKSRLNGRDYSVSVISNILELNGNIPFSVFKQIDEIRRFRNNIVHQDPKYECKIEDCYLAIKLALTLILEDRQLKLEPNLSYKL